MKLKKLCRKKGMCRHFTTLKKINRAIPLFLTNSSLKNK